jgi:uncharacterized protein
MEWLNEPAQWQATADSLIMTADPQTDFWRKTHDGGERDTGHFYFQPITGDFVAQVRFSADYHGMYDHAGLMVRLDNALWLKCGIEYMEGVQHASAVVTRDYSDWSIVPLSSNPPELYLRLRRYGITFEVSYSLTGADYTMIRQAYLSAADTVNVGMMAAAPKGDGFEVRFADYEIE